MAAALIGREDGVVLSEYEHKILGRALALLRSKDQRVSAIASALPEITDDDTLGRFLDSLLSDLGSHVTEFQGLLFVREFRSTYLMEDDGDEESEEANALRNLLRVMRRGNWLGEFLEMWLQAWVKKTPTPAQVMTILCEDMDTFDMHVDNAKAMMRNYPELLGISPIIPPAN